MYTGKYIGKYIFLNKNGVNREMRKTMATCTSAGCGYGSQIF